MELQSIIQLEEAEKYKEAFEEYEKLFAINKDFELWKHYYFFLWYIFVESSPLGLNDFVDQKIYNKLQEVTTFGINNFINNAEALFIMGYTQALFPWYFTDKDSEIQKIETEAEQMLKKASDIKQDDLVYRLAYLSSEFVKYKDSYEKACIDAAPEVKLRFNGKGLFDSYFRQVLYRID